MKKIIYVLFTLGVIAVGVGVYMYNKPHKDYTKEKPDYEVRADNFQKEFFENEKESNQKYLGRIVQVKGTVAEITFLETGDVSIALEDIMNGVTCMVDSETYQNNSEKYKNLVKGGAVTIKGRCDGMLTDVRLSKCILVD